ncbi:hypothetical protein [Streptomyces sp. NPDC050804]|uniref:hypothetical protein n=1 Tax=Streptomyces sp. NPDC050804 TaxID=3154745 RepID=UPI00341AFBFE
MGQLAQLLDADAGVPQRLDCRPVPEGGFLFCADVHQHAGVQVHHAGGNRVTVSEELVVRFADHPAVGGAAVGELFSVGGLVCSFEQQPGLVVAEFDVLDEDRQEWLALAGAVSSPFVFLASPTAQAVELARGDGAGGNPSCPAFGLVSGPGVQVIVEAADRDDDVVLAPAVGAVVLEADGLAPAVVEVGSDPQALLAGVEFLDRHPKVLDSNSHGSTGTANPVNGLYSR